MANIMDLHSLGTPQRKTLAGLTLAIVPLLVASTALIGGGVFIATPQEETLAAEVAPPVTTVPQSSYAVVQAKGSPADADVSAYTPKIAVEFPPEPEPVAAAPAQGSQQASGSNSTAQAPKATAKKSDKKKTSTKSSTKKKKTSTKAKGDYKSFCPTGANASVGGSSAKSMLSAINSERSRMGSGKLSWSGSLASAAQKWSESMAKKDDKSPDSPANALSHNSNRPSGGENVGVTWSSKGRSASQAMSIVHSNFMLSNSHCENLMNPKWSKVGVGLAQTSTGAWYITQNYQ